MTHQINVPNYYYSIIIQYFSTFNNNTDTGYPNMKSSISLNLYLIHLVFCSACNKMFVSLYLDLNHNKRLTWLWIENHPIEAKNFIEIKLNKSQAEPS